MTVYAIADEVPATTPYIIAGKQYEVFADGEDIFRIYAEKGLKPYCRWTGCAHLYGGNWRRVEGAE